MERKGGTGREVETQLGDPAGRTSLGWTVRRSGGLSGPCRDGQGLAVPGGVPRGPDRPEAPGEPRPGEPPARVARVTGGGEAGGRPDPGGDGRRGPRGAGTAPRGTESRGLGADVRGQD